LNQFIIFLNPNKTGNVASKTLKRYVELNGKFKYRTLKGEKENYFSWLLSCH